MISRKSVLRAVLTAVLVLSMCVAAASGVARAQWKAVAPLALVPAANYGAMYFKDGVLWAGWKSLVRSTDSGRTWVNLNLPDQPVFDISFADKNTGIITTQSSAFLTHDAGATWTLLPAALTGASRVAFGPSPSVVYTLRWADGKLNRSLDGGATWQNESTNTTSNMTFAVASNGTICVISNLSNPGTVSLSTDSGSTWHRSPSTVGRDCWTLVADPGDADRFYLTEENNSHALPVHLYATLDGGNTWNIGYTDIDVDGSLSISDCAIFAGTGAHGVMRSTDFGASWQQIGGPNGVNDNRMVCAINGNIVFAVDSFGTIWGTYNGGSDSVSRPINGTLSVSRTSIFDTVSCSDSVPNTVFVVHDGCFPPAIRKCSIAGADSSSYRISATDFDSLNILFHPVHGGTSNALLLLSLNNGSTDTIRLSGWNALEPDVFSSTPNRLFYGDTLSCDSEIDDVTIHTASGCTPPDILEYSIAGQDSNCYRISGTTADSIRVVFAPNHSGEHHAELLLALSNGTVDTILLGGSGLIGLPLSLATSDESTNTIGGDVSVPITISGLEQPEDVDLTMHYVGDVHYDGSFDRNGMALDVPGKSWPGRASLELKDVMPGSIAGYSRFRVFADSSRNPTITFDSISVLTSSPCEYAEATAATSSITGPSGCGTPILSEILEGKSLVFSVRPNPARSNIFLKSPTNVDSAIVEVFDAMGIKRQSTVLSFRAGCSAPLSVPSDPGIYYLRIQTQNGIFSTNLLVTR